MPSVWDQVDEILGEAPVETEPPQSTEDVWSRVDQVLDATNPRELYDGGATPDSVVKMMVQGGMRQEDAIGQLVQWENETGPSGKMAERREWGESSRKSIPPVLDDITKKTYRSFASLMAQEGESLSAKKPIERFLTQIPEQHRQYFNDILAEETRKVERKQGEKSFIGKASDRLRRGVSGLAEGWRQGVALADESLTGTEGLSATTEFVNAVQDARRSNQPRTSSNLIAKGALAATEMMPSIAGAGAVAATTGGLGVVPALAAETGYWWTITAPQNYKALRSLGATEKEAGIMSAIASIPEALVETALGKTLDLVAPGGKAIAMQSAKRAIKNYLTTYAKEWAEEPIQAVIAAASVFALDQISSDLNMTVDDWKQYGIADLKGLGEAALALPFLMAPGHMAYGARGVVDYHRHAPQLREEMVQPDKAIIWSVNNMEKAEAMAKAVDEGRPISRSQLGELANVFDNRELRAAFAGVVAENIGESQRQAKIIAEQMPLPTAQKDQVLDEAAGKEQYKKMEEGRWGQDQQLSPDGTVPIEESEAQRGKVDEAGQGREVPSVEEEAATEGRQEAQGAGGVDRQAEVRGPDEPMGGGREAEASEQTKEEGELEEEGDEKLPDYGRLSPRVSAWQGERDVAFAQIDIDARKQGMAVDEYVKKQFPDMGRKERKAMAMRLRRGMHRYIDLKGIESDIDKYSPDIADEVERDLMELSQSLPEPIRNIADQIAAIAEESGQFGVDEGILHNIVSQNEAGEPTGRAYAMRLWEPTETQAEQSVQGKFAPYTARSKHRTYSSYLEGVAKGRKLKVDDAIEGLRISRRQVAQAVYDRNLIKRSMNENLMTDSFNDAQARGYKEITHPTFKKWVQVPAKSLKIDPDAEIEVGDWVRAGDRNNLGRVVEVRDDMADVLFVNRKKGTKETVSLPMDLLKDSKVMPSGVNFFITQDGKLFERRTMYAEPKMATELNTIFSKSALKGLPGASGKAIDIVTRYNDEIKQNILLTALFHPLALMRSYMLAGRGLNPWTGAKKGREALLAFDEDAQRLVRNRLTLGLRQEWDEAIMQDETVVGRMIDRVPYGQEIKDKLLRLRAWQNHMIFDHLAPYLKLQSSLLEYHHLARKHAPEIADGSMSLDEIAYEVAYASNADFGGLHHADIQRHATTQHIFRLLALAPDWTESNIRMMASAFKGGLEGEIARGMWFRVALKAGAITIIGNMAMAALDDDTFFERTKKAWKEGHFRWMDIDITPIFRMFGGDVTKRKYFSVLGHFRDPLKFFAQAKPGGYSGPDPIYSLVRSGKHKGSVLTRFALDAATGVDWSGRGFTTWQELVGIDDKGVYQSSRKGFHKTGEPKGGKLKGRLVTKGRAPSGQILGLSQVPSFLLYETRQAMPIPIQGGCAFLAGEMDAFDWITKSTGLTTATTYPKDQKEDLVKIANAMTAKRPTYRSGSIAAYRERRNAYNQRKADAKAAMDELGLNWKQVQDRLREMTEKEQ